MFDYRQIWKIQAKKRHNCNVHEGTAAVVEVQDLPITIAIEAKLSNESSIKIDKKECRSIGCKNYELCSVNINKDKKYKILKILEKIECPLDYELKKAEISEE